MTVRHMVLLRFAATCPQHEQAACLADFAALANQIDGILSVEQGPNISTEGMAQGYTHAVVVSFADVAARDAYLPHPAHQAFVARLTPVLESALVFDYAIA